MASEIICENTLFIQGQLALKKTKANIAARNIVVRGSRVIANTAKEQFRERQPNARDFPPQPPNPTSRTGNLRDSIRMLEVAQLGMGRWTTTTGSKVVYAKAVEYGHGNTGNKFPFMRSGLEGAKGVGAWSELRDIYREEWAAALE